MWEGKRWGEREQKKQYIHWHLVRIIMCVYIFSPMLPFARPHSFSSLSLCVFMPKFNVCVLSEWMNEWIAIFCKNYNFSTWVSLCILVFFLIVFVCIECWWKQNEHRAERERERAVNLFAFAHHQECVWVCLTGCCYKSLLFITFYFLLHIHNTRSCSNLLGMCNNGNNSADCQLKMF